MVGTAAQVRAEGGAPVPDQRLEYGPNRDGLYSFTFPQFLELWTAFPKEARAKYGLTAEGLVGVIRRDFDKPEVQEALTSAFERTFGAAPADGEAVTAALERPEQRDALLRDADLLRTLMVRGLVSEPTAEAPYGFWVGQDGRSLGSHVATIADVLNKKADQGHDIVLVARKANTPDVGLETLEPAGFGKVFAGILDLAQASPSGKVPVDAFYAQLYVALEQVAPGMLKQMNRVIDEAFEMADRKPALGAAISDNPDQRNDPAFRERFRQMLLNFMVQSYLHSYEQTTTFNLMGFSEMNVTGEHDLVEEVPLEDIQFQLDHGLSEPWLAEAVKFLAANGHDSFNAGALNPHYLVAMYRWGDSRHLVDGFMDPHRAVPHHNGNSHEPTELVERATNFVTHHGGLEHNGVRHEPHMGWEAFDRALEHDAAITNSGIGRSIAREAAVAMKRMSEAGYLIPWHLLELPQSVPYTRIDRAYQSVQLQMKLGNKDIGDGRTAASELLGAEQVNLKMAVPAIELLQLFDSDDVKVPEARALFVEMLERMPQPATQADRDLVLNLGKAVTGLAARESARGLAELAEHGPVVTEVEGMLQALGLLAFQPGHSRYRNLDELRADMGILEQLPSFAAQARDGADSVFANTLEQWASIWKDGFRR